MGLDTIIKNMAKITVCGGIESLIYRKKGMALSEECAEYIPEQKYTVIKNKYA